MENLLKKKLADGRKAIGTFVDTGSATVVECLGRTGLDFVIIDNEHSPIEAETSAELIRAAELSGITPLVRVKESSRSAILKLLDVGAQGLIIPNVHSVDQVRDVITHAKYRPVGDRGFCSSRKDGWGFDLAESIPQQMEHLNRQTLLIPQCETVGALEAIEEIVALEGVDGIFLGPFDLSISMGIPGEFDSREFMAARDRILCACHDAGKPCMRFTGTVEQTAEEFQRGFDAIAYNMDAAVLIEAFRERLSALKALLQA